MTVFEEHYKKYTPIVRAIVYRSGVRYPEDVLQDVWMKIFIIHQTGGYALDDNQNIGAYYATLAKNYIIDQARKKRVKEVLVEDHYTNVAENDFPIDELYALTMKVAEMKLTAQQKELVCLRYREGLSFEEISDKKDLNQNTARVEIYRAKNTLRKYKNRLLNRL